LAPAYVIRLDVAVDAIMIVQVLDRSSHVIEEVRCFLNIGKSPCLVAKNLRQVLLDQKEFAGGILKSVSLDDVGMRQRQRKRLQLSVCSTVGSQKALDDNLTLSETPRSEEYELLTSSPREYSSDLDFTRWIDFHAKRNQGRVIGVSQNPTTDERKVKRLVLDFAASNVEDESLGFFITPTRLKESTREKLKVLSQ